MDCLSTYSGRDVMDSVVLNGSTRVVVKTWSEAYRTMGASPEGLDSTRTVREGPSFLLHAEKRVLFRGAVPFPCRTQVLTGMSMVSRWGSGAVCGCAASGMCGGMAAIRGDANAGDRKSLRSFGKAVCESCLEVVEAGVLCMDVELFMDGGSAACVCVRRWKDQRRLNVSLAARAASATRKEYCWRLLEFWELVRCGSGCASGKPGEESGCKEEMGC